MALLPIHIDPNSLPSVALALAELAGRTQARCVLLERGLANLVIVRDQARLLDHLEQQGKLTRAQRVQALEIVATARRDAEPDAEPCDYAAILVDASCSQSNASTPQRPHLRLVPAVTAESGAPLHQSDAAQDEPGTL